MKLKTYAVHSPDGSVVRRCFGITRGLLRQLYAKEHGKKWRELWLDGYRVKEIRQ